MTQKELLYFEDAVKHEDNVIKIIDLSLNSLSNEELINFMNGEKEIHNNLKNNLMNMLEVKVNEWYSNYGKLFVSIKK